MKISMYTERDKDYARENITLEYLDPEGNTVRTAIYVHDDTPMTVAQVLKSFSVALELKDK